MGKSRQGPVKRMVDVESTFYQVPDAEKKQIYRNFSGGKMGKNGEKMRYTNWKLSYE